MNSLSNRTVYLVYLILWANFSPTHSSYSSDIAGDENHMNLFYERYNRWRGPSEDIQIDMQVVLQDITEVNDVDQSFSAEFRLTYMW